MATTDAVAAAAESRMATPDPATAAATVQPADAIDAERTSELAAGGERSAAWHDSAPSPLAVASASPRARAEQIVNDHLPLAIGAGMLPLPGLDLAVLGGLQLKLLASLAKHYNVRFTQAQAQLIVTSLLGSVGTTLLAGAVLGSVAKIVPFFGTLVGAASMPVAAGVVTRAMGNLAIEHFSAGGTMETFDLDVAQQAFLKKIAEAKAALA